MRTLDVYNLFAEILSEDRRAYTNRSDVEHACDSLSLFLTSSGLCSGIETLKMRYLPDITDRTLVLLHVAQLYRVAPLLRSLVMGGHVMHDSVVLRGVVRRLGMLAHLESLDIELDDTAYDDGVVAPLNPLPVPDSPVFPATLFSTFHRLSSLRIVGDKHRRGEFLPTAPMPNMRSLVLLAPDNRQWVVAWDMLPNLEHMTVDAELPDAVPHMPRLRFLYARVPDYAAVRPEPSIAEYPRRLEALPALKVLTLQVKEREHGWTLSTATAIQRKLPHLAVKFSRNLTL